MRTGLWMLLHIIYSVVNNRKPLAPNTEALPTA